VRGLPRPSRPDRPAGHQRFAACTDCHADAHAGQFARSPGGADCARCHTVAGFSPATFTVADHARTAYPLAGAHLATPCVACHARPAPTAPPAAIPFRFRRLPAIPCRFHGLPAIPFRIRGFRGYGSFGTARQA